jgi:hypothetical protein
MSTPCNTNSQCTTQAHPYDEPMRCRDAASRSNAKARNAAYASGVTRWPMLLLLVLTKLCSGDEDLRRVGR